MSSWRGNIFAPISGDGDERPRRPTPPQKKKKTLNPKPTTPTQTCQPTKTSNPQAKTKSLNPPYPKPERALNPQQSVEEDPITAAQCRELRPKASQALGAALWVFFFFFSGLGGLGLGVQGLGVGFGGNLYPIRSGSELESEHVPHECVQGPRIFCLKRGPESFRMFLHAKTSNRLEYEANYTRGMISTRDHI